VDVGGRASNALWLHLLGRCNLECLHCYMDGSPRRREQLPVGDVVRAIGECGALGIGELTLTGGEPLLYKELDQVLDAAARTSLKITVCTNGTVLTERRAAQFSELGVRASISIDGRPEYHDRFRKLDGAFHAAERGVRAAVEAGVPVTIISTITKANLDSVEFLVEWGAAAGAGDFFAQPLLDLGRGTEIAGQCLSFDDVNRMMLQLTDLANRPRTRSLRYHVFGSRRKFLAEHPCGAFVCNGTGCHRGVDKEVKKVVVREDGSVLPEVPNLDHRYSMGKLQDNSLSELVGRYYERGYDDFDRLCRAAYAEVLPAWDCVIVPWEQIIAERSRNWVPRETTAQTLHCISCATPQKFGVCRELVEDGALTF
jgi:MoaA/NifB/PqqE/SkfB family radical SAM enzyme